MDPTVRKIDFFGGLHGHYLELIVNIFVDQNKFDLNRPFFNTLGACHLKNHYDDYAAITKADHWSWYKIPFDENDRVIQIVPESADMLIAVTNSFLRSGDHRLDIKHLEKNTISKLSAHVKLNNNLNRLVADFGHQIDYNRSDLRNYFYSMFHDAENGIDQYRSFDQSVKHSHQFPFRAFFDWYFFLSELNNISKFVELEFVFGTKLVDLHTEFLNHNHGYHSELKCKKIIEAVLMNQSMDLDLNLIEEAWINYQFATMFDIYDHSALVSNRYPTNTLELSRILYN